MTFIIDFTCHWDEGYPVENNYGCFSLHVKNELEVFYYLLNHFLHNPHLLDYYFMIDDGQKVTIFSKEGVE